MKTLLRLFLLLIPFVGIAQQKAELFVLSIGVSQYSNASLNLHYADKDARDLAAAWRNQTEMYKVVEVKTLTNEQATRQAVRDALDYFKGQITSNDMFVFIFSGHGMNDYLVPYDFNRNDKYSTALSKDDINEKIKALGCNYIMLLDACHSGSFAKDVTGKDVDPGAFSLNVEQAAQLLVNELSSTDKTNIVIGSSSSDQRSFECDACQNGYFAQAVLDCFEGKSATQGQRVFRPDNNSNGFISMHEFDEYIKEIVRITTQTQANPQKVYSKYSMGTDVPMIRPTNAGSVAPSEPTTPSRPVFTDNDPDGDGFKGSADECPTFGTVRGCPDGDEDGIADKDDDCPYEKGISERRGCPAPKDSDNDGIPDTGDECPYDRGEKRFAGCPDSDADGVPDNKDNCKDKKGSPSNKGCPEEKIDLPDNMLYIAGGTFSMGSDDSEASGDEKPIHSVTLSDFYMGKYEVTVAEFKAFVDATSYKTDAEKADGSYVYDNAGNWTKKAGVNWRHDCQGNTRSSSEYNHPVVHVSWNDAKAYCAWLTKTLNKTYGLPTEAQWEYAARAKGKAHKYAWGNATNPTNGANVADETAKSKYSSWSIFSGYTDNYVYTCPVAASGINDIGLYGMSGNVWEWCEDWYDSDYYKNSPTSNPTGPIDGADRVLRGGSWNFNAQNVRCAIRNYDTPDYRNSICGFRVVRIP